ncbi:hypothetical protein [Auritidibacter ignavus]|uniref:hypothetical protein n=1 Tax=Auritidibacter ignavus TaxID=678932 RepID=UPI0024496668|nr:hypothetical protein [Auritidibacter ignavus]WGH86844.1 hypothetical protein QDX24_03290 [Auritidibacter ignavus]WGH89128.1 hypothetical protein QDX22_03285 [Auritidibacter ignavus]WHS34726.1 hypothetical protein QM403_10505 [Auritidibacter ignavus]
MNHFLRLELSRYLRVIPRFGATVACSTLMGLYFFTFVGRFDDSSDSAMLREPAAVITLALTLAFCVVVIYGTVVYQRFIVSDYIGNRRIQLYSYPGGRSPLFLAKNTAYALAIGGSAAVGLVLGTAVFLTFESFMPVSDAHVTARTWPATLTMVACITLLTLSAITIAGFIGVRRRSTVSSIVTAVILIVLFGNAVAMSLNAPPWVPWTATAGSMALALSLLAVQNLAIQQDEVL